jgi:hypothetical protein
MRTLGLCLDHFGGLAVTYNNFAIPIYSSSLHCFANRTEIQFTMKISSVLVTLFALATSGLAQKTCTPSFDYCSDVLIKDKGNGLNARLVCYNELIN